MSTYRRVTRSLKKAHRIHLGDIYEDCSYQVCVCCQVDYRFWERTWRQYLWFFPGWLGVRDLDLKGISLLDGKEYSCSARHCAPVKLTGRQFLNALIMWQHREKELAAGNWQPSWAALQQARGVRHRKPHRRELVSGHWEEREDARSGSNSRDSKAAGDPAGQQG